MANRDSRCHNPNDPDYPNWGARGIIACEQWRNSFKAYLDDNGIKPLEMTLDRSTTTARTRQRTADGLPEPNRHRIGATQYLLSIKDAKRTLAELAKQIGVMNIQAYRRYRVGNSAEQIAAWAEARRKSYPSDPPNGSEMVRMAHFRCIRGCPKGVGANPVLQNLGENLAIQRLKVRNLGLLS